MNVSWYKEGLYERKNITVWSHDAIFHQIFNGLAQVSRLESIVEVTRYDFTIDFQLKKTIN